MFCFLGARSSTLAARLASQVSQSEVSISVCELSVGGFEALAK